MKYTDGKYIYYASPLLGENKFAICKKEIGSNSLGNHKYRSRANKTVETIAEAIDNLQTIAKEKDWKKYLE